MQRVEAGGVPRANGRWLVMLVLIPWLAGVFGRAGRFADVTTGAVRRRAGEGCNRPARASGAPGGPLLVARELARVAGARAAARDDPSERRRRLRSETSGAGNAHVEWAIDLDPDAVFEVELEATNDMPCVVRLFWRREGEAFSFERHTAWPMPAPGTQRARRVLRGAPGFVDGIVAVRIQIEAPTPVRLELATLEELGWSPDFGVDRAATDPLSAVRFGSEVRPAFLLAPGEHRLQDVPAGRWRLRGAAVHTGATARTLKLTLERGGVVLDSNVQAITPVEPEGQTVLWPEVFWDVDLSEPAQLVYELADDGRDVVVVAALSPLPRVDARSARAVLVSLDTVRADILGVYDAPGDPSPRLDRWARSSTVFEHAYSTSSWTLPSHVSMLTGFWPTRHAVEGGSRSYPATQPSLARALREAGYWTEAWTEGGFVDARFGHAHGFDPLRRAALESHAVRRRRRRARLPRADDWTELHVPAQLRGARALRSGSRGIRALCGRATTDELPSRGEMWAWMEAWRANGERLAPERLELLFAAYRAGIPRVDREMGRFLDGLEALPDASPEIVAVTSDHGDVFQERTLLLEHGRELQPELLRVPLVISTGRASENGRRRDIASIVDLPATFLDLLGLDPIEGDGRALFGADRAASAREAVEAAVQPPYESAYRIARITPGRVDELEIGEAVGPIGAMAWGRLEATLPAADRGALEARWLDDQRGRTEIAIRFEAAQRAGVIEIATAGVIRDAVAWPTVAAALDRPDERTLRVRLVPGRPTRWLTLALETTPRAAGLHVSIPEALGALEVYCGTARSGDDPIACARAASESGARPATLASMPGGWIRIVHHAGEPFLDVTPDDSRGSSDGPIDAALAAQLEALGYGDTALSDPSVETKAPAVSGRRRRRPIESWSNGRPRQRRSGHVRWHTIRAMAEARPYGPRWSCSIATA